MNDNNLKMKLALAGALAASSARRIYQSANGASGMLDCGNWLQHDLVCSRFQCWMGRVLLPR
jgi:hypothetical protein